jgi:glycosyltransferase involved in cell wall biosynthesis
MISILSPTRKRPQNITRLVDSIVNTVSNISDVELLVYIDDDDEESIPALQEAAERINVNAVQGNKLIGSQMYNELGKLAQGEIIMFAADDIVFGTKNWDLIVQAEFNKFEDKILFVYGNDGFQNGRIGTHGFIHRHWVDIVGYVLPPQLASSYTDEWVTELAIRAGRNLYLPDLMVEHFHPANGKAPNDETYQKRIEVAGDIAAYYKNLEPQRVNDANKLMAFIQIFSGKP